MSYKYNQLNQPFTRRSVNDPLITIPTVPFNQSSSNTQKFAGTRNTKKRLTPLKTVAKKPSSPNDLALSNNQQSVKTQKLTNTRNTKKVLGPLPPVAESLPLQECLAISDDQQPVETLSFADTSEITSAKESSSSKTFPESLPLQERLDILNGNSITFKGEEYNKEKYLKESEAYQYLEKHKEGTTNSEQLFRSLISDFILEKDIIPIGKALKKKQAAVSFRDAGIYSLLQLEAGAGAKGHAVLEKSVKPKTVEYQNKEQDTNGTEFKKYIASNYFAGMEGLVAQWDKVDGHSVIGGLYLTERGKKYFETEGIDDISGQQVLENNIKMYNGLPVLKFTGIKDKIKKIPNLNVENWHEFFFTGDYDTHDLVSFGTSISHSPSSESFDEGAIIAEMKNNMSNAKGMLYKDMTLKQRDSEKSFERLQHGPQVNYAAHNLDKEFSEDIIQAVMLPSVPLAMCDQGNWRIIKTVEELRGWYIEKGVNIKNTWADEKGGRKQAFDFINGVSILEYSYEYLSDNANDTLSKYNTSLSMDAKSILFFTETLKSSDEKYEDRLYNYAKKLSMSGTNKQQAQLFVLDLTKTPKFSEAGYIISFINDKSEEKAQALKKEIEGYMQALKELYKITRCSELINKNQVSHINFVSQLKSKNAIQELSDEKKLEDIDFFEKCTNTKTSIFEEKVRKLKWRAICTFIE